MKKSSLITILFTLFLVAYTTSTPDINSIKNQCFYPFSNHSPHETTDTSTNSSITIIEHTPHFRIFRTPDLPPFHLTYEIYNAYGEIIRKDTGWRIPNFRYISQYMLEISFHVGLSIPPIINTQYYSITDDIFSDTFENPFFIKDRIIAYVLPNDSRNILIVRDIFDPTILSNEFPFNFLPSTINPFFSITNVEYIGDNKIRVTHLAGNNHAETTTILELYP